MRGTQNENHNEEYLYREMYEIITHSTLELIFVIDRQGRFVFFNDRLKPVLGYLPEEALGTSFVHYLPVGEVPGYIRQMRRIFIGRKTFHFVTRIRHKDGHLVDAEIIGQLTTYRGEIACQGTIRDISERKRMEDALHESANSYKGLFDTVSEAIYVLNEQNMFIDVNIGATNMYGYSREELIGRTPELVSAPGKNDLEEVGRILQRTWDTGISEKFEFWGIRKNGEIFPKDVISNKGKYFGQDALICTARDVSERKRVEQALRDSETKYRILAEKMHDVVWIIDLELRVTYVSPSTYRILGYTPGERMSMRIDECMVPDSLDYAMQVLINEAVSSQEGHADKDRNILLELEYYHKDGTTRWLEQSINGIYDDKGELSAIMGVARDVTERRKAREALEKSVESYRGLFNSVSDAIYVLNREGTFIDVNEGAVKMYGYPRDMLVGKNPAFTAAEGMNDLQQVALLLEKAYQGEDQQFDFWGKRANGESFLKDVRLHPGKYFGEKVIIALARDITARHKAE